MESDTSIINDHLRQTDKNQKTLLIELSKELSKVEIGIYVLSGKIIRDMKSIVRFADAGIAASCIHNKTSFLTLNKKDLINISELKLYSV